MPDDVRLIRELGHRRRELLDEAAKISDARIAEKFGISKSMVQEIVTYAKWRSVLD